MLSLSREARLPQASASDTSALPRVKLSEEDARDGIPVIELFLKLEFGKSKGEIKRLVSGGGARLNDAKIEVILWRVASRGYAHCKYPCLQTALFPASNSLSLIHCALATSLQDPNLMIDCSSFDDQTREIKLSSGKKKHGIIELVA